MKSITSSFFLYPGIKKNQKDFQLLDAVEKLELYVSLTLLELKKKIFTSDQTKGALELGD